MAGQYECMETDLFLALDTIEAKYTSQSFCAYARIIDTLTMKSSRRSQKPHLEPDRNAERHDDFYPTIYSTRYPTVKPHITTRNRSRLSDRK